MPLNSVEPDPLKTKVPWPGSTIAGAACTHRGAPVARTAHRISATNRNRPRRGEVIVVYQIGCGVVRPAHNEKRKPVSDEEPPGKTRSAAKICSGTGG